MRAKLFLTLIALMGLMACEKQNDKFYGVVEGFYGRPWGTEGRKGMITFLGENGLDLYVYGPKDDPYHTERWAEPYPEKEREDFKTLLAAAKRSNVKFYWAIHLGSAFQNIEEYEANKEKVFAKLEDMYSMGFRYFGVFFDDYGQADAEMHTKICNDIVNDFLRKKGDCGPLIVCPNIYHGDGANDYDRYLGEHMDPEIMLVWTGQKVCCDIDPEYARSATDNYKRPPLVWWNWPVNDYSRSNLIIGRLYGLPDFPFSGIMLNPMENCEASKIGVYSFAQWAKDKKNFDSQKVWERSFQELYPEPIASAMQTLARHNSGTGPNRSWYEKLESEGITDFSKAFADLLQAVETLKKELPRTDAKLFWELEGWIDASYYLAKIGLLAEQLPTASPEEKQIILKNIAELEQEKIAKGEEARQRFADATFASDKGRCVVPLSGTEVLRPRINKLIEDAQTK